MAIGLVKKEHPGNDSVVPGVIRYVARSPIHQAQEHDSRMQESPPDTPPAQPSSALSPITGPAAVDDGWVRDTFARIHPIIRRLGAGASGAVYLARDNALHRVVALKVLAPDLAQDPGARDRFQVEARVNARLCHPNIVPVHHLAETAGIPYLTMRYVPGMPLGYHVWRRETWPLEQVARVLSDVAGALDYAHREQVVHRDVKPENILLDKHTGSAMLADFGIARGVSLNAMRSDQREAERGFLWGTPHFMSPEQAAGHLEIDGRADLYALGIIGYALLAGRLPFEGDSVLDLMGQHLNAAPPDLERLADSGARRLVPVIMQCLAKHPNDRWADGRSLREAILEAGRPVARSGGRSRWWNRWRR